MAKDIEPKLKLISEYLSMKKDENFIIPEYQRGYSWTINHCDKLWQDIEGFMELDSNDPYFFGTIIVDCSVENKFSLIDGQQRTITFFLLLKALLIRLQEVLENFERDKDSEALEEGLKENRNKIIKLLYKASVEDRIKILNDWSIVKNITILENKSINEKYKNEVKTIIEAKNIKSAEKDVVKIPRKQKDNKYTNYFRNFKYFYNNLLDKSESQLNKFAKVFLENCQIIEIRSWQVEQAITMFNSLNSTGLPLSDADIISAQLYSKAGENKEEFNKKWEYINTLTDKLNTQKIVDIDAVLQQYMYIYRAVNKEYLRDGSVDVTLPGLRRYYTEIKKELLDSPLDLCDKLLRITQIWDNVKDYPIIKLLLKFNENVKLYLAGYFYRFEAINDIIPEKILGVSESLLRLFALLELVDSGYSSKNFKTFLFSENIKLVDKNVDEEEIINDFNTHIQNNWRQEDIYELILEYDKNILVFLNEYLFAKNKELPFDFDDNVNIEHIMPSSGRNIEMIRHDAGISDKDEFKILVNKLGNKILLEENINKSISNEWFKTKKQNSIKNKEGYKDSKYPIASTIVSYPKDVWTKEDINSATDKAAKRILTFIFNK